MGQVSRRRALSLCLLPATLAMGQAALLPSSLPTAQAATFAVTNEPLPSGTNGTFYTAPLGTVGSHGYCGWSVNRGSLPAGLQLAVGLNCQAQIVGTPVDDTARDYTFRVEVFDMIGDYSSARLSIAMRGGPKSRVHRAAGTPSTTRSTPGRRFRSRTADKPDWSGYVVGNGPYKQVQGTFTVPYVKTSTANCDEELGEWVGLDGADTLSKSAGKSVLQAGVGETMTNPYTGTCSPGQFYIWPWWEVTPQPEKWVFGMTVDAGDRITVRITDLGQKTWQIKLRDDSNGGGFTVERPYSPVPTTAEWVIEATEVPGQCGVGVDPTIGPGICRLDPFAPDVNFSGLATSGHKSEIWDVNMVQHGSHVSTPSPFTSKGFSVAYTGAGRPSKLKRKSP